MQRKFETIALFPFTLFLETNILKSEYKVGSIKLNKNLGQQLDEEIKSLDDISNQIDLISNIYTEIKKLSLESRQFLFSLIKEKL